MAEAHQAEPAGLVLGQLDRLLGRDARRGGSPRASRAPRRWPRRAAGPRGHRRRRRRRRTGSPCSSRRRGPSRCCNSARGRRAGAGSGSSASTTSGLAIVLLVGHREHHVQEVGDVAQLRVGIDERQAQRPAVGIGGDRPHLADQAGRPPRRPPPRRSPCTAAWKQERVLIIAESMAIGGASTGKPFEVVLERLVQRGVARSAAR